MMPPLHLVTPRGINMLSLGRCFEGRLMHMCLLVMSLQLVNWPWKGTIHNLTFRRHEFWGWGGTLQRRLHTYIEAQNVGCLFFFSFFFQC